MKYPGQKNIPGLIQKIVNEIPYCSEFYELFAGSAAVSRFLSVLPGVKVKFYLNDISPVVTEKNSCTVPKDKFICTSCDYFEFFQKYLYAPDPTDKFIFLDPPYLHSTRPDNTAIYDFEMTENDHIQLLKSVQDLKINTMIIHPVCELYETYLKDWRYHTVKIRYHQKLSIEKLYMNYEKPSKLLTTSYLGIDCWDRQRIKRKGERIINKINNLPPHEKQYILERIKEIK